MSVVITPSQTYRRAFKKGMSGWDVAALQIALNSHRGGEDLVVDGDFGAATDKAVRATQRTRGLTVDGIAGLATQTAVCVFESRRAEKAHDLPRDLLRGIVEGESLYCFAAATALYANGSRDLGPCQFNTPVNDQARVQWAFDVRQAMEESARRLAESFGRFEGQPGAAKLSRRWELAVLNHNWPSAAANFARGLTDWTYVVLENGVKKSYRMSDPAPWVVNIGVKGVETGLEWAAYYIESKTIYVDW